MLSRPNDKELDALIARLERKMRNAGILYGRQEFELMGLMFDALQDYRRLRVAKHWEVDDD